MTQTAFSMARLATLELHEQAIARAIDVMRDSLDLDASLDSIAKHAAMSRFHFNRVFRELTGVPPIRFLFALRIQRAKELLLTSEERVIDICYTVGYSSLGSFGNTFRRRVGVAPRAFRTLGSRLCREWRPPADPAPSDEPMLGLAVSPETIRGPLFIGFFRSRAPWGAPLACACRIGAGRFATPQLPDGRYFALAVATDTRDGPEAMCLQQGGWRGASGTIWFRNGRPSAPIRVMMRPAWKLDPPVLPSPPVLLAALAGRYRATRKANWRPLSHTSGYDGVDSHPVGRLYR